MTTAAGRESPLAALSRERYVAITTFRRDGSEASTPVWVVSDDPHRLLVATGADTWKVRRIERNAHVRVTGCNARGKVHGETIDGTARLVDEGKLVRRLQDEKYGWQKRLIEAMSGVFLRLTRKPRPAEAFIEITPREELVTTRRAA
jgi:PPOX class probable F420-dependent enzyme